MGKEGKCPMSLPLLHAGKSAPGLSAALDLRFALDKSLTAYRGPTPSFSRASTGTYFNSSGVLTSASINTPRFNHTFNGTSWVSRGLLVEEQRTNLILYSNLQSSWYSVNATLAATTETTSPDGTNNSRKLTEDTTASTYHYAEILSGSPPVSAGVTYTASCFVKANGRTKFYINSGTNRINMITYFDLSNGTITSSSASSSSITNVGDGWYRCTATQTASSTGATSFQLVMADDSSNPVYTGDGIKGVFIFGYQVEQAAFATSLIPTTSASATRSADVCQITGGNFSSIWNGTEGSFAVEYDLPDSVQQDRGLINANDGTNSKYISLYGQSASGKNAQVIVDSALQVLTYGSTISANTSTKMAACWKLNDFVLYSQGTQSTPDTSGAVPSGLTQLEIGKGYFGGDQIRSGHIARLRYFNKRLPNATLQQLST
jgi:hypothetical protein